MKRKEFFCDNCEERIEMRGNESPCGREGFSIIKGEPMAIDRRLDLKKDKLLAQVCYQCLRTLLAYRLPRRVDATITWSRTAEGETEKIGPIWSDPPILPIEL